MTDKDKVGRNDPCPCGSGKKYKNCHMLQEKESAAAKYTPSGKRKFKAKVITLQEKSLSIFNRSATVPQATMPEADTLQKLKFRMTKKDFRTKTEEKAEEIPFQIPKSGEPFEKPQERERHLPGADESFNPTKEDFRKKEK